MKVNWYGVACLVLLLTTLLAFAVGRRLGKWQGYRQGLSEAPLRLRVETLQNGVCPICDSDTRGVVQ